ncbi:hypothetical protein GCU60_15490 [Blastococcus saxobsidens]|uniref:Proline dehydrogenase n=1 Tax=Blastococcus saxobsidens TaxID=138336 RepID=A0A6L9W6W8_9ACTN|nr:hypothetical protein [Blastococcus saxobsidens]NEK87144.1 hypothetical protein [Blastococcus saxobsidens]
MSVGLRPRRLLARIARPGPAPEDAVRAAGDLVAGGCAVGLEVRGSDPAGVLAELAGRLDAAGLAASCEVTVRADRFVDPGPLHSAPALALALDGPPTDVDRIAAALPAARVVVHAAGPEAVQRCRAFAGRRVRLVAGRGVATGLSFVRCLNVLMAGAGEPAVATTDPRLIAVTGERAAWNGRPPQSWEHVMPWGHPTEEQHRLLAAGHTVRVLVPVAEAWS